MLGTLPLRRVEKSVVAIAEGRNAIIVSRFVRRALHLVGDPIPTRIAIELEFDEPADIGLRSSSPSSQAPLSTSPQPPRVPPKWLKGQQRNLVCDVGTDEAEFAEA